MEGTSSYLMVVLTLVYVVTTIYIWRVNHKVLGVQTKQLELLNENLELAQKQTASQAVFDMMAGQRSIMSQAFQSKEYLKLFEPYSETDFLHTLFINHQFATFTMWKNTALPDDVWQNTRLQIRYMLSIPSFREQWTKTMEFYPADYRAELQSLIIDIEVIDKHIKKPGREAVTAPMRTKKS